MTTALRTLTLVLLTAVAGRAAATGLIIGHWQVAATRDGRYSYAATTNERRQIFGEFCSFTSRSCRWLLAVRTPCRFGDVYPVLLNTATGTNPIAVVCLGPVGGDIYGMVLLNGRRLQTSVERAGAIDFAVPRSGGGFAQAHFQLAGGARATAWLRQSFSAQLERRRRIRRGELRL